MFKRGDIVMIPSVHNWWQQDITGTVAEYSNVENIYEVIINGVPDRPCRPGIMNGWPGIEHGTVVGLYANQMQLIGHVT